MSTYNVYANKKASAGKETAIWCGNVRPVNSGYALHSDYAKAGAFFAAGHPFGVASDKAIPFVGFVVTNYTTSSDNSIITVKPIHPDFKPLATDVLQKVGATFAATGKAWKPSAVAENATDAEAFDITVATADIDVVAAGDVLTYSAATAKGSSKSIKVQPVGYLYNDIAIDPALSDEEISNICASAAIVKSHRDGFRINLTLARFVASQMLAACPAVIQSEK